MKQSNVQEQRGQAGAEAVAGWLDLELAKQG
jgi:hypothetical protein